MARVVDRAQLGTLTKVGQGGQGVVYQAPNGRTKFSASIVYKEYRARTLAEIDFVALDAMSALVEDSLPSEDAERLISMAAWPCAIVETSGAPTGFVMPAIPDQFFLPISTVKGIERAPAEFQHLLNEPSFVAARGITLGEGQRYELLLELASALAFFHQTGICIGDISPKNILFSITPQPAVYFVDCDTMRINGVSALPQVETPGWEAPDGEELATVYSDSYKLALLALRLLVGDQDAKRPRQLPSSLPKYLYQLISDTLDHPPLSRPLPEAWISILTESMLNRSHQGNYPPVSPPMVNVAGATPTPVLRSRPPVAQHASTFPAQGQGYVSQRPPVPVRPPPVPGTYPPGGVWPAPVPGTYPTGGVWPAPVPGPYPPGPVRPASVPGTYPPGGAWPAPVPGIHLRIPVVLPVPGQYQLNATHRRRQRWGLVMILVLAFTAVLAAGLIVLAIEMYIKFAA